MAFSIFDFSFHEGKYSYYTVRERDPQSRWQEEHPARYNLAKTIYWANYLSTLKLCPFGGVFCCWGCCCWAGVWNSGSIHHVSQVEDQVM
jgi:hypothetical protein